MIIKPTASRHICLSYGSGGFPQVSKYQKLDYGMIQALRAYEESTAADDQAGVSVSLHFTGDLAAIEALGFETFTASGTEALGIVRFKDLPALVAHPDVLRIAAGRSRGVQLDTSAADIRARSSSAANVGVDGLWDAVAATGTLSQTGDATGAGVIVAVIDTGIDFTHPTFMSQLTPTKSSRIVRIWDQGLTPGSVAECPNASLLVSSDTYGVEYKNSGGDSQIDDALNGGAPVLHRDCNGHGTHVAATAAGGVEFATGGDAAKVGVAPEADIIAVKLLDTPDTIQYRLAAGTGTDVGWTLRFRDSIAYCLNAAGELGKPVVINMSLGSVSDPGDGLDEDAIWVDKRLDPAQPAGPDQYPEGAILVKAAGNSGDVSRRMSAHITVPAGGSITVPLQLTDARGAQRYKYKNCANVIHKPPIGVTFWYKHVDPASAVKFALRLPHQVGFNTEVERGGTEFETGFTPVVGPPRSVTLGAFDASRHRAWVYHDDLPAATHPSGGSVRRHKVAFDVLPKENVGAISYHDGIYEMRITAPAGTKIYAMGDISGWGSGLWVRFEIASRMQDGSAPDAGIVVTTESTITDPLGQHVITAAAYDDTNGVAADPDHHAIAGFSSRGPLRDFSDPPGSLPPIANKPDIAAPGVKIDAALSQDTNLMGPMLPSWYAGVRFTEKSGTSMAAPMVAGVIALMLDKKPDLSTTEARNILAAAATARPGVNPAPPGADHQNAYGTGMIDALPSHTNTP